jgi:hypothetical protein
MKSFDPEVFFGALPSFYRDKLPQKDRVVLAKLWEGVARIIEDEYSALFQTAANARLATSSVLSPRSWVYHEFDNWEIRKARHRHIVKSFVSGFMLEPRVVTYYLGAYFDLNSTRMYFDGKYIPKRGEIYLTNEPDQYQLEYMQQIAASPSSTPVSTAVPGTRLVFDLPFILNPLRRSVEEQSALGIRVGRFLNPNAAFTIEADGELYQSNLYDTLFQGNNVKKVFTIPTSVNPDTLKIRASTWTKSGTVIDLNFDIYPKPFSFTQNYLTLASAVPPGITIKVSDSSGVQSFTTTKREATFKLSRAVDPDTATVTIFNIDLGAVEVADGSVTFSSAPVAGLQLVMSGEHFEDHDHARYRYIVRTRSQTISFPANRPLRLKTNQNAEDQNFPIKVYINGILLRPPSIAASSTYFPQYTISNSSTIQLSENVFVNPGDQVDVEYTDEEDPISHVHRYASSILDKDSSIVGVEFDDPIDATRFPKFVDRSDTGLVPDSDTPVAGNFLTIVDSPAAEDDTRINARGAIKSLRYSAIVPTRIDESENYRGTLVSADAMQDGIDAPTVISTGEDLQITLRPDLGGTLVESNALLETAWFKNALIDDHLLSDMLGVPARFEDGGRWTEDYRKVLVAFYAAMRSGSTVKIARDLMSIALGSEYSPISGISKGVDNTQDGDFFIVETAEGEKRLKIDPDVPFDNPGRVVPAFHPINRNCEIIEGEAMKELNWLPFVAQHFGDYQYGKRVDAFLPVEVKLDNPILTSESEAYSLSFSTDISGYSVWPIDLIEVVVLDESQQFKRLYLRPQSVNTNSVGSSTQLVVVPVKYGIDPFGNFYGARLNSLGAVSAKLYTRTIRQRDTFSFADIMIDEISALAEGESIQAAAKRLGEVLSKFIFAARIAWNANIDFEKVNNAIRLLDRAKPADVGVIPFTQVEDGALQDVLKGEVVSEQVLFKRIPAFSVTNASFINNIYIGSSYATTSDFTGLADAYWWEEKPQVNFTTDPTHGKYISSVVLGTSTWLFDAAPMWRAVIWDNVDDDFAIIDSSSITWTTSTSTTAGVTTTTLSGSTTYQTKTFSAELYIEESATDVKFWHKVWGPTGETRYSINSSEFPRMRIKAPGAAENLRFLDTSYSGYVRLNPISTEFKNSNGDHLTVSSPPALPFYAIYDSVLRRGMYLQFDDTELLWKQATFKGLGTSFEIFWTHYPKNNFTPGQYTSAAKYTQPYKFVLKNLQIKGNGETGYYDAAVMYRNWVETTQPFFLPAKWRADSAISASTKQEKLFLVLFPSAGMAFNEGSPPAGYVASVKPAANFFPVLYEIIRTQQFFNDPYMRVHIYEWHKNVIDVNGIQNSIPAKPKPDAFYTINRYDFAYYNATFGNRTLPINEDNISFMDMLSILGYMYDGASSGAPRIYPYVNPPYWQLPDAPAGTWTSPVGAVHVKWTSASESGGTGDPTAYIFTTGGGAVDVTQPSGNYFVEKQTKSGGTRALRSVDSPWSAPNSYTFIPKFATVANSAVVKTYGVDFSRSSGRTLAVDLLKKIYTSLLTTTPIGTTTPTKPKGFYLDQLCGYGTYAEGVGSAGDCFVLWLDGKNAVAGDYGNTGDTHEGRRLVSDLIRTTMRGIDPDMTFSSEACEEAHLGKIDMMHAGSDHGSNSGKGPTVFTFPIVYNQYQRMSTLDTVIDPANAGGMAQEAMRITNTSYHRGYPLAWNISFSAYLSDAAFDNPQYPMRHFIDYATAPVNASNVATTVNSTGQHIVSSSTTVNITPHGIVLAWLKKLYDSMTWVDDYRLGEMLRPLNNSVDIARIKSGQNDIYFYNVTLATQMQSAWLNPVTGNIGILITEAYPGRASTFKTQIDSVGWPLWSGTKYVYKNNGTSRVLIQTTTANSITINVNLTGMEIVLIEIARS